MSNIAEHAESAGMFDKVERDWNRGTDSPQSEEISAQITLAEFEKHHKELDEIREILDQQGFEKIYGKLK